MHTFLLGTSFLLLFSFFHSMINQFRRISATTGSYGNNFFMRFSWARSLKADCENFDTEKGCFMELFYSHCRTCNVVCTLNNSGLKKFNDKQSFISKHIYIKTF